MTLSWVKFSRGWRMENNDLEALPVATEEMASGFFDNRTQIWTLEYPTNYDDFHTYDLSHFAYSQGDMLAGNLMNADDAVIYVYPTSASELVVDTFNCAGLYGCSRFSVETIPMSNEIASGSLRLERMARGAVLSVAERPVTGSQASDLSLMFLDEDGVVLGTNYQFPVGNVGEGDTPAEHLKYVDVSAVSPTLTRPWYDILMAMAVDHDVTGQIELRLARVRACSSK